MNQFSGKPVDRSAVKPIYLVVASDPLSRTKQAFYVSSELTEGSVYVEIRGYLLTKAQVDELSIDKIKETPIGTPVNRKIPWHQINRIDSLTYKPSAE